MHHGGTEVREELELAQGVAGGGGDGQHADLLGPVLEAEATGEHTVTGSILEDVLRTAAHHPQAAGDGIGPFIQVLLRMQDDRGIAGGSTGRVQAHALVKRNRSHPERIGVAKILLGGKGNLLEVIERTDIRRRQPVLAETLLIERRIHAMLDRGLQPLQLQGLYL